MLLRALPGSVGMEENLQLARELFASAKWGLGRGLCHPKWAGGDGEGIRLGVFLPVLGVGNALVTGWKEVGWPPAWSPRQSVEDVLHGARASQNVWRAAAASDPYPERRAGSEAARMTWQ